MHCSKNFKKENITFEELAKFDLNKITDELLKNLKDIIYKKYLKEGGNNKRIAKNKDFINTIIPLLKLS